MDQVANAGSETSKKIMKDQRVILDAFDIEDVRISLCNDNHTGSKRKALSVAEKVKVCDNYKKSGNSVRDFVSFYLGGRIVFLINP